MVYHDYKCSIVSLKSTKCILGIEAVVVYENQVVNKMRRHQDVRFSLRVLVYTSQLILLVLGKSSSLREIQSYMRRSIPLSRFALNIKLQSSIATGLRFAHNRGRPTALHVTCLLLNVYEKTAHEREFWSVSWPGAVASNQVET